jgi:cell division protein FtsB
MKQIIFISIAAIAFNSFVTIGCCGKKTTVDTEQVKKTKEDAQKSYEELDKEREKYKE